MLNISLNLYYIFFSLGVDTTLLANRLGNEKNKRKMRSIPMVIPCIQTIKYRQNNESYLQLLRTCIYCHVVTLYSTNIHVH